MGIIIMLVIIFIIIVCYSFEESSYNEKHKCDEIEFRAKQIKTENKYDKIRTVKSR